MSPKNFFNTKTFKAYKKADKNENIRPFNLLLFNIWTSTFLPKYLKFITIQILFSLFFENID